MPGAPSPSNLVEITIGSIPSDNASQKLYVSAGTPPPMRGSTSSKTRTPLSDAIRARAGKAFAKKKTGGPSSLGAPSPGSAARATHFVVHCTAFGASDETMLRWVANRKAEGARNKSHGVVLPSGAYLPLWPFNEARVWATKTETCRETSRQAFGNLINIELHYFCAQNRPDKASDAQYEKLADIYKGLTDEYGPLIVVSHREVDRGLRDGHNDPLGFDFDRFYRALKTKGVELPAQKRITQERHMLRTDPDISHQFPPLLAGPLVLERMRPDDCRRDHP